MEIKELNIYEKLALITDEIGTIEKNLNVQVNKTASYKAVSERDVLDNVKPIEKKYRVYSYPAKRVVIDSDTLTKETEYNGVITKTNTLFMRIETVYRFVNIDKPEEYVETIVYGDGIDTGDKAPGKAMTYADKYALMKTYKLSTGDDLDKEASPEKGYQKQTKTNLLATEDQIKRIKNLYSEEEQQKALQMVKKNNLESLTVLEASSLIGKRKEQK